MIETLPEIQAPDRSVKSFRAEAIRIWILCVWNSWSFFA